VTPTPKRSQVARRRPRLSRRWRREAEVPLGNVYYYFKTKDDIGEAIVELRLAQLSAQRQRWNEAGSPKDRLCACVQDVFENKDFLAQRGCAVGTFCSELHKAGGSVATRERGG
jgi:AcrR family transcriptional regulator